MVIFDAQKQFLLSGNGSENYDISSYDGSNAYMELENGAGGVVLQAVESQIIRCYYAFAMDKDAFWAEVSSLRLVGLITCVLCIALTVILVFRSSRQVYIPIGRAVRRVEQMGVESYDRMQHNEIEFIELMMEKSSSEKLELQRQAKIGKNLQTDQFIHALLAGKLDLHKPDQEILAQAGFPACSDFWCAVLIFVKKRVDMDITTQDFVIQNVFEEVANEHNYGYLVDLEANQYALLLNLTKNVDAEEGMAKLCECQENIRQLGLELVVASGRVHKGLKNVHLSYEEAELAMKYKYLLDDASYIHYEDISNREFSYTSSMESNLSRDVVYFINGKNPETSGEEFVSGIMDMCDINGASSMDNIECFKYEIFSIINKAFMICGIPESGKDRIAELMIQPTLKDFRIKLAELMELLRDMKKNGSKLENTCLKAMQYIQEKYWDPQLSLTQMGVELNISPYYLSKLFKERYEISISDFLAKVRIQMAKEQLRSTDHSIRMIAEECGFLSSNVFIRVFKKWEGITPGAYREQEAERAKETADEVKA